MRSPVPAARKTTRRTLADRLEVRAPGLARVIRLAFFLLPPGSRLRREMLTGSIRRSLEAFNRRDWDVFMHLYRDDSEFIPMPGVGGDTPGLDIADRYVGATGVREFFAAWEEAWEVFEADPQEVIDFGDSYLILLRLHGRARGSGLEIDQNAGHLYRWRRGMIGRAELYGSREQALAAVGLGRRG